MQPLVVKKSALQTAYESLISALLAAGCFWLAKFGWEQLEFEIVVIFGGAGLVFLYKGFLLILRVLYGFPILVVDRSGVRLPSGLFRLNQISWEGLAKIDVEPRAGSRYTANYAISFYQKSDSGPTFWGDFDLRELPMSPEELLHLLSSIPHAAPLIAPTAFEGIKLYRGERRLNIKVIFVVVVMIVFFFSLIFFTAVSRR